MHKNSSWKGVPFFPTPDPLSGGRVQKKGGEWGAKKGPHPKQGRGTPNNYASYVLIDSLVGCSPVPSPQFGDKKRQDICWAVLITPPVNVKKKILPTEPPPPPLATFWTSQGD
jgi:hypothetical protein